MWEPFAWFDLIDHWHFATRLTLLIYLTFKEDKNAKFTIVNVVEANPKET